MTMQRAMRQMSAEAERSGRQQGAALSAPVSDQAPGPRHEPEDTGPGLLSAVLAYVRSLRAGERVMRLLRRLYGRLRLKVNEAKSAIASVFRRKFLGYSFWVAPGGKIKRRVASKAMAMFKQRVRELTRRSCGRSLSEVVKQLRVYVLGWKAYFRRADTPGV